MAWILAALVGAKSYIFGAAGIAAAVAIGILWLQLGAAHSQVDALKIDNERLSAQVIAQQLVISGKQDAIDELERTSAELAKRNEEYDAILAEIRRAPVSDSGPISPVLSNTLKRLRN